MPIQSPRILLVDDEKIVCTTLACIFESNGYEVHQAHSAEDSLQLLDDWVPDLAIVDVCLLKMNGAELARRIQIRNPNSRAPTFRSPGEWRDRRQACCGRMRTEYRSEARPSESSSRMGAQRIGGRTCCRELARLLVHRAQPSQVCDAAAMQSLRFLESVLIAG